MNYPKIIQKELYLSEHTFKEASSQVKAKKISSFLEKLALTKNRFRKQLFSSRKTELIEFEKPSIKFDSSDTQLILVKCLNEEESLIKEYQKALNTNKLDENLQVTLSRQLHKALSAFNQLRAMKLSHSYVQ